MDVLESRQASTRGLATYGDLASMCDEMPTAVRITRRVRGLSLREAGDEIGIGFKTVARIESGHDYTITSLRAVIKWLGGDA